MSDDEDDLIDLDEAWESPPMSPHERRLWGPGAEASPQTAFGNSPGSNTGGSPHTVSGMSGNGGGGTSAGRTSEMPIVGGRRERAVSRATLDILHPIAHNLTAGDAESCVSLEKDAFRAVHRHDPHHILYCLTNCSAICLGLFTSTHEAMSTATYQYARSPDSFEPDRKAALVAHIVATKTTNSTIHDEDVQPGGHKEEGQTIVIQSFGVLLAYRRNGLGSMLLRSYISRMKDAACAERIAVLANEEMIEFYRNSGFMMMGDSQVSSNADHLYDMVLELKNVKSNKGDERFG